MRDAGSNHLEKMTRIIQLRLVTNPLVWSFVGCGINEQKLALIEIKVAMAHLLRDFSLELVPGQTLNMISAVTTGLKDGLRVKLTPR